MAKKKVKRAGAACHITTIKFKTKRGKVISFKGHQGASCGPRKKPSTKHLKHWQLAMKAAAKHCKGKPAGAFRNCVATQIPR